MAGRRNTTSCISLRGSDSQHHGYGRMFLSLRDEVSKLVTVDDSADLVVNMIQPFAVKGWWEGQRRVIFTMWETNTLPRKFSDHLSQYETVLVPCEHNRELFSPYHDDVRVVQLGVDTEFWVPSGKGRKPGQIRFLAGGSHWTRKGLDAVVKAFLELNPSGVQLIIKTIPDVIGVVPQITDPRITVIQEYLTLEQERDLYRSADLFIAASRGEGWGMMPLQAICAGIPTLLSDTSGHREFLHLASRTVTTTPRPVNDPPFYTKGLWDEPDHQSLIDGMTWFLDSRKQARADMAVLSSLAHEFSWANSAGQLIRAVGTGQPLPELKWEKATLARVRLRVKRRVRADIGEFSVDLAPGVDHMVPVNVRDVIVASGQAEEDDGD